jgi:hypothetical protein
MKMTDNVYSIINGGLCGSHVNEHVCLVGHFTTFQGNERSLIKIKTTDGIIMMAQSPSPITQDIQEGSYLLIEGRLSSKNKIVIDSLSVFPSGVEGEQDFDERTYNEMVSCITEHGPQFLNTDKKDLMEHWGTTDHGPEGCNVEVVNGSKGEVSHSAHISAPNEFKGEVDHSTSGISGVTQAVRQSDSFDGDLGDF